MGLERWLRQLDWTPLLIPLIGLVAAWPFLTGWLPSTDDGALHLLRLAEIDRCLRHGVLPLRWAPDFAHGYGYPFYNYYASLSSYMAELWHLAGLDFPAAIAAATMSALLVSGWGAYLLARDLAGRKAGLIAATAYMYAPYQFYDSAYRGNLAESWALALLPWVLWTGRRAALADRWRQVVPAALAYGALIYTHNVYALITSPLIGAYLLLLWWIRGHSRRGFARIGASVALGLALCAFFWLPAFFERGWTRFSADLVDYRSFFLPLRELFSLPPQVDLSLLNYYPPRSLSWGMLTVLLLGLGWLGWRLWRRDLAAWQARAATEVGFFAAAFLLTSWMTTASSDLVWRTVPLLNLALIPWRYLGIASLAGCIVAGVAISLLPDRSTLSSPALLASGTAVLLLIATAIPWTYAAPFPQPERIGVPWIVGWEYSSKLIGTTAKNEYLPIWSPQLPPEPADPGLLTDHDPIIARFDTSSLPVGGQVLSADYTLMRAEIVVRTPEPFQARYKQLYFPGWEVRVDGRPVTPIATSPYGLLGFEVPAGEHRISVRPVPTPLRLLGETVSVLAIATMLLLIVFPRGSTVPSDVSAPGSPLSSAGWAFIVLLALGALGIKEGVIDRTENIFRAYRWIEPGPSQDRRLPGVGTEVQVNFGDLLTLNGYDLPQRTVASGEALRVDLYLSARQRVDGEYMAYARLVDEGGRTWSPPYNGRPEGFRPPPPTTAWPNDAYGHWAYLVDVAPGTPPGSYWIQVGLFERDTWRGLNVLDEQGRIVGLSTQIGPVEVGLPRTPPDLEDLDVDRGAQAEVGPTLRYLGSRQNVLRLHAGEPIELTLFWQAAGQPSSDYHLNLALVGAEGVPLGENLPLGRATHPTSAWQRGEVVRSPHRLRIPATTEAGTWVIQGEVIDAQGQPAAPPITVGEVIVQETARQMTAPQEMEHRVDADLSGQVTLLGYDLGEAQVRPGADLPVTLYWQAQREMEVSYKVFVQLIGPHGILGQADAVPGDWQRPTTGWIPGEVVQDVHTLALPTDAAPGSYALIAGLYDETTLRRLALLDASGQPVSDRVLLANITVR